MVVFDDFYNLKGKNSKNVKNTDNSSQFLAKTICRRKKILRTKKIQNDPKFSFLILRSCSNFFLIAKMAKKYCHKFTIFKGIKHFFSRAVLQALV